jgi:hypothetical protein
LWILLSVLTGLLLTTLLSALARFLLLALLRLTCATLLTALLPALVLLASALIPIHIIFSIAGDTAQSNVPDANSFAECDSGTDSATQPPLRAHSLRFPRVR